MKKGSNVLEYTILAVVVGLTFGFAIFNLMVDKSDNSNRLQKLFLQSNQAEAEAGDTALNYNVRPATD